MIMKTEYNSILGAKRSLRANIEFMETLLKHLKGTDKILRGRACWTAWCLHNYFNDHLMNDIQHAIEKNSSLTEQPTN